jgi:hypothetical protein
MIVDQRLQGEVLTDTLCKIRFLFEPMDFPCPCLALNEITTAKKKPAYLARKARSTHGGDWAKNLPTSRSIFGNINSVCSSYPLQTVPPFRSGSGLCPAGANLGIRAGKKYKSTEYINGVVYEQNNEHETHL